MCTQLIKERQMKSTFAGKVEMGKGNGTANIYRVEGGYIVREIKPFASKVGPVLFSGRVFKGSDFEKVSVTDLGYGIDRIYRFKGAA
jgi:hypothetical protein